MSATDPGYIPALAYHALTPLYDVVMRFLRERAFKTCLLEQAAVRPGHRVLDVGCGTGTLLRMLRTAHPEAEAVGLDADPRILAVARRKADRRGLDVRLDRGRATALPYDEASFDRVVSSLVLHHLARDAKMRTFREVLRVLRPGGTFHMADFGAPQHALARLAFLPVRCLDGFGPTADNVRGLLPGLMERAGFEDVRRTARFGTVAGTIELFAARRPLP